MARTGEELVNTTFTEVQEGTTDEMKDFKKEMFLTYQKAINSKGGGKNSAQLEASFSLLSSSIQYFDTLKNAMAELSSKNPTAIKDIDKIFIEMGLGDSIYHMMCLGAKFSYNVAATDRAKRNINELSVSYKYDNEFEKRFTDQFHIQSPDGVILILYSLQVTLYKLSIEAFKSYST